MSFSFSTATSPMAVRLCRALVWTQAVYTLFTGVFVLLAAVLLSGSLTFDGTTISGSGAAGLGLVYVGAAVVLAWLGVEIVRRASWARAAIVVVEVLLTVLQLLRAVELSLSLVITLVLLAAIITLLFLPDTQRSLGSGRR